MSNLTLSLLLITLLFFLVIIFPPLYNKIHPNIIRKTWYGREWNVNILEFYEFFLVSLNFKFFYQNKKIMKSNQKYTRCVCWWYKIDSSMTNRNSMYVLIIENKDSSLFFMSLNISPIFLIYNSYCVIFFRITIQVMV